MVMPSAVALGIFLRAEGGADTIPLTWRSNPDPEPEMVRPTYTPEMSEASPTWLEVERRQLEQARADRAREQAAQSQASTDYQDAGPSGPSEVKSGFGRLRDWWAANSRPAPMGSMTANEVNARLAEPAPVQAPAVQAEPARGLPSFQTAVEADPNAAPIAGGLTPLARPGAENVPSDLAGQQTPVTSFRVSPAGETMAEPGAEQIAPDSNGVGLATSARGINRIKGYEDFRSKPYEDYGSQRIGYGTDVQKGDTVITEEEADKRLREKTAGAEKWIKDNVKGPLNQDQFDSLVSFYHNAGVGAAQTLLPTLNKGDYGATADHMLLYNKVTNQRTGKKELSAGLLARRHGEADLMRNTSGEPSNRDVPAKEASIGATAPAKVAAPPSLLERMGVTKADTGEFKPAYPGQEPERGGLIQRLTGMKFNPLGLSDRERWALMASSGVGQFDKGAQVYSTMRGQDISAAQHGQQLALEAMRTNHAMAQPTVMNEVMGPFGEVHKQYGRYNPQTGVYEPYAGPGAGGAGNAAASPYGGVKGDLHDQVIQALHSGKSGEDLLKLMPPEVATVAKAVGSYQRAPMQGKAADSPQGQIEYAAAKAFNPDYDPSQYTIMQKTRQDMLSGAMSKVLDKGNTAINHLTDFFDKADVSGSSSIPTINRIGNQIAELRGKPGGAPARDLAGSAAEEMTAFYRGTGGTEGDIERHLGTLNENMSTEQRKAMAGVLAEKMEGKINALQRTRDEAFKGAEKKAPPIMTEEAKTNLEALRLYARNPTISMQDARAAIKSGSAAAPGSTQPAAQLVKVDADLSVPAPAIAYLLQNPGTAAKFDETFKKPGAAAKVLAMYQHQGAKP